MSPRTLIPVVLAVAALFAAILFFSARNQRVLERGLPPRVERATQLDAANAAASHGVPLAILGTGSMAPYIPAALPTEDPKLTIVAYANARPGATYADVTAGTLCIYRPEFAQSQCYMHSAYAKDGDGWIMSGLHNNRSESWARMTERNFVGIVDRVYVWKRP